MLFANTVLSLFSLFPQKIHCLSSKQVPFLNWYTTSTMASRWSKRRKIRSQLKATEAEILQTFEEKFRGSNMQGSTIIIKHTDCQSVEIQSGLSASGPGTEDVPICEDWENEPNSLDNETHEPMDTVNDNDSDSEHEEEPSLEFLLISLRYWASKFSVSLVALTALLSILRVSPKIAQRCSDSS